MPLATYRPGDSRGFAQKEEEKDEDLLQFGEGLSAGWDTTIGTLAGVRSLFNTLTGDEAEAIEYMGYARDRFQQAAESGGTVTQLDDIEGVGDVVRWASYSAGTILPSIATSIAGGGVVGAAAQALAKRRIKDEVRKEVIDSFEGKVKESVKNRRIREVLDARTQTARRGGQIGGAMAASTAQNTGATFVDIYEETGIEAPDVALAAGVVSGALDSLVPLAVLKRVMPGSTFAKFKDELADKVVQNGGVTRRILQEAVKNGSGEGLTEAAQELIQATAVGMMRNDPQGGFAEYFDELMNPTTEDLGSRLMNAAAVGFLGGGVTGGASGFFKGEPTKTEDPKAPPVDRPDETAETDAEADDTEAPTLDSLTGAAARMAQQSARAGAREELDAQGRRKIEGREERNEQRLQVTLRNVGEGRRVAAERIPQSLLETGNVTPEENAAAAQEYEENKPQVIEPQVEVKPLNVNYDPETDEFTSRGKRFKYLSTLSDDQGRPEKIVARDLQNGKEKTFRSQRLLQSLTQAREGRVDPPSDAATKFADVLQFDAMPAAIQQAVLDDADAVVSDDDTVDLATMVQAAQKAGLSQDLIDRTKAIAERQQTRTLDSEQRFTEKDEWREYQGPIAPRSIPLEQRQAEAGQDAADKVRGSIGSRGFSVQLGSPLTLRGIKQFDPDDVVDAEIEYAIYDLLDAGLPTQVFDYLKRLAFHDEDGDLVRVSGLATSQGISLSSAILDQVKKGTAGRQLRWSLSHEMWHILDKNLNIAASLAPFKATVSFESQTIDAGDVVAELYENYLNETELGKVFIYPFHWVNEAVTAGEGDPAALEQMIQEEVFAQLGAIYLSNPELVQSLAPSAFEAMQAIAENPALPQLVGARDAVTQDTRTEAQPDPAGVPGEVRAPAVARSDEVPDDGRGGDAGVGGVAQGEAGEGLGGEADTQDGDGDRPSVPEVERPAPTPPSEEEFSPDELRRLLTGVQDVNEFTVADLRRVLSGLEALSPTQEEFTVSDLQQLLSGVQQRDEFTTDDLLQLLGGDSPESPAMMRRRGPTGRPYQGLPANETLGGEDRVQTSLPNGTRLGEKIYEIGAPEDYSIGIDRILTDTSKVPLVSKLKTAVEGYDFFTPSRADLTAEETIEEFKTHMVENLVWLHDQMDPALRDEAKQWYDGARKQVDIWVDRYGLEPRQVAAVIANLSPQKDWFMNMSLAERMMDVYSYRQDYVADAEMNKAFTRIVLKDEKGKLIQVSKIAKDTTREAFKLQRDIWKKIKNQPLSGVEKVLSPEEVSLGQAIWIRMYDEANHSRSFRVMSPSGEIMGPSMGKDGPQKVAWGSFTEIMKGVQVLRDGSLESVSLSLGDAHKVRNFYNNIVAPDSQLGEVTIDTHAVAAAVFKPLSAKGYEVSHAFGSTPPKDTLGIPEGVVRAGAGSSAKFGAGGTYGIIADAYREAAEKLGILPRQLQSITWEEIRVIFPASFKDEKGVNLGKINELWTRYANGELSVDQVREQAYGLTGTKGNKPVWADRSDAVVDEEQGDGTYSRDVYSAGVPGQGARGRDVRPRGDGDAAGGAAAGGLERPSFQRRLSGQTKSYDDAVADGTRLNGEPNTNELNLDDETRAELTLKKWQDKYLTVKKLQEQAKEILGVDELPERLNIHGAETLSHGKIKNDYDGLEDNYVKPIGDILRENDIDMDDAALYLIAKHAKERNEYIASINESLPDGGSGLTTAAAAEILENAENKDALEEIAQLVYDMLEENRKRMADAGLLSEDTVDGYREQYQFYVPLKGFAAITVVDENGVEQTVREQSPVSSGSTGRGFSITGKEVFKALGRESRSDNPLLYALKDTEEKIVRSRKNEVSQRFLELVDRLVAQGTNAFKVFRPGDEYPMKRVEKNGQVVQERMSTTDMRNDTIEGTKDPKYMSVKVDGEEVFIEIKSPALNRAMQNLGAQQYEATFEVLNKSTTAFLQKFQNFRRNMLINYNPSWFLINPVRDIQTGIMFSLAEESKEGGLVYGENLTADILKNYFPAAFAYRANLRGKKGSEYDGYFEEYQASGAPTGQTLTREIEEQQQRLENIISEGSIKSRARAMADWIEDANTAAENAVRFAAYIAAREKGVTVQKAALLAKNMTVNFNRKGEASSAANLFYLFFNAAVQGTDQIVKAMSGRSPTGGLTKAQMAGIAIATSAYAITKYNIEAADEDDDGESLYNDLSPYDKLMSWNYVRPDGKTFFQMPLPYGYGLIHTIGRLAAEYEHDAIDGGEVAAELTAAFVHHMLPPPLGFLGALGTADDATEIAKRGFNDLVPDIFEFPATVATNMNHFGAPIYIEDNPLLPPAPDSSKAKRSTEKFYRDIAESMNEITGGSLYRTGSADVSPDVLKYAVDFFGGGLGRFITRGVDTAMINNNDVDEDDRPMGEWPIFRYLYGEPSAFNDKLEYYDNIRDSQEVFKENEGTTDAEERERFLQRFGSVAQLEPLYKETQKQLRALRKKKKQIEKTQSDPSLAYTQIQKLEADMEKLYDQYNKRYREATR